jgi:hypothetical protein
MPPLLVGAAGAIAAEVAVGILLYAGPGLIRSLTTVLAVEGAALAAGLQTAPRSDGALLDSLRRRWLLCLAAFMAAALFGTAWSLFEAIGAGRLGQGLGLALLAGLPMFAVGALLGGMGTVSIADESGRMRRPSAAAALGAALGFVATGLLLPRAPIPASLLVGCLVLLSGAGMVYGAVLTAMAEAASRRAADHAAARPYDEPTPGYEGGGARAGVGDAGSEVASVGSTGVDAPPP